MPRHVATGALTLVDVVDLPPAVVTFENSQSFVQVFEASRVPQYQPDRSAVMTVNVKVLQGGADIGSRITNIKWGSAFGLDDLTGVHVDRDGDGLQFRVKTNNFVAVDSKTVYFQGDFAEPYTGLLQQVYGSFTLAVLASGATTDILVAGGQTVIRRSPDGNYTNSACVFGSLYSGSLPVTQGLEYQWRVGPAYGAADILDANHPLVAAGHVKFKSHSNIANNDMLFTGSLQPADGAWGDFRGIVCREQAINGTLLLKCMVRRTTDVAKVFEAYVTMTDLSDNVQLELQATSGTVLRNGAGTTQVFPRITTAGVQVNNLNGWRFDYYLLNADGRRGGFATANTSVIGYNVGSLTFTVSPALATAPAAGTLIKVAKNGLVKHYAAAAGCTTTAIVLNANSASVFPWLGDALPGATEFVGGTLHPCMAVNSYTMQTTGTKFSLSSAVSFNLATSTFTTTVAVSAIAAGDIVAVWHPTLPNRHLYFEVATVSGTSVVVKQAGHSIPWLGQLGQALPAATEFNGGFLMKVTTTVHAGESHTQGPVVTLDSHDVQLKASVYAEVTRP